MPQALDAPVLIATRLLDDPQLVKWEPVPWGDVLFVAGGPPYPALWREDEDLIQGPLRWAWIVGASVKQYRTLIERKAAPGVGQRRSAAEALKPFLGELAFVLGSIDGGQELSDDFGQVLETWTALRLPQQPARSAGPLRALRGSPSTRASKHPIEVLVLWPMWRAPKLRREKKKKPDDVPVTPRLLTLLGTRIHESADWRRRTREDYEAEVRGLLTGGPAPRPLLDHAPAAFDFARGISAFGAALSRAPDVHVGMEVDALLDDLVDRLWDLYAAQIAPLDRCVGGTEQRGGGSRWLQVLYPVLDVLLSGTSHLSTLPRSNTCFLAGRIMQCLELWAPGLPSPDEDDHEAIQRYKLRLADQHTRLYQRVERIQDRRPPPSAPEPRKPTADQEVRWGVDQRWRRFHVELVASTAVEWKLFVGESQPAAGSSNAGGPLVYKLFMTRRRSSDRGWLFKHQVLQPSRRPRKMRRVALDELLSLACDPACKALDQAMVRLQSWVRSAGSRDMQP